MTQTGPVSGRPLPPLQDGECARRLGRQPTDAAAGVFAVVLNCIDGRAQQPLLDWVRARYDVDFADVITEPGIDALLAVGSSAAQEAVLDKVCVSRLAHLSCHLVVAGHHDCAASPVDRAVHEQHLRTCVQRLRAALPRFDVTAVYLDETWTPCPVVGESE